MRITVAWLRGTTLLIGAAILTSSLTACGSASAPPPSWAKDLGHGVRVLAPARTRAGNSQPGAAVEGEVLAVNAGDPADGCTYMRPTTDNCTQADRRPAGRGPIYREFQLGYVAIDGTKALVGTTGTFCTPYLAPDCVSNHDPAAVFRSGKPFAALWAASAKSELLQVNSYYLTPCVNIGGRWYVDNLQVPYANEPAGQLWGAMRTATEEATSVHVRGTLTNSAEAVSLDLSLTTKGAIGTMGVDGGQAHVVITGRSLYVDAPAAYYENLGAPSTAAQLLGGRWVQEPTGSVGVRQLDLFSSAGTFFRRLLRGATGSLSGPYGVYLTSGVATVEFQARQGDAYIAAYGTPRLIELKSGSKQDPGSLTFTGYDQAVTLTIPKDPVRLPG